MKRPIAPIQAVETYLKIPASQMEHLHPVQIHALLASHNIRRRDDMESQPYVRYCRIHNDEMVWDTGLSLECCLDCMRLPDVEWVQTKDARWEMVRSDRIYGWVLWDERGYTAVVPTEQMSYCRELGGDTQLLGIYGTLEEAREKTYKGNPPVDDSVYVYQLW